MTRNSKIPKYVLVAHFIETSIIIIVALSLLLAKCAFTNWMNSIEMKMVVAMLVCECIKHEMLRRWMCAITEMHGIKTKPHVLQCATHAGILAYCASNIVRCLKTWANWVKCNYFFCKDTCVHDRCNEVHNLAYRVCSRAHFISHKREKSMHWNRTFVVVIFMPSAIEKTEN